MQETQRVNTLTQIAERSKELDTILMALGGELTETVELALKEIDTELLKKADGYFAVLTRAQQSAQELMKRENEYKSARKAIETAVERIRDRIKNAMQIMNTNEITGSDCRFKLSKSQPSLIIENINLIPEGYKKEIVTVDVDRAAIKGALESGIIIEGARLVPSYALKINTGPKREVT